MVLQEVDDYYKSLADSFENIISNPNSLFQFVNDKKNI
jgi:hypothetical protein